MNPYAGFRDPEAVDVDVEEVYEDPVDHTQRRRTVKVRIYNCIINRSVGQGTVRLVNGALRVDAGATILAPPGSPLQAGSVIHVVGSVDEEYRLGLTVDMPGFMTAPLQPTATKQPLAGA